MKKIIVTLIVFIHFASCSLQDNDSPAPAYIVIDSVSLETTVDQGFPSHQIDDIFAAVNEQDIGVYPLPAKIPFITEGKEVSIRLFAGVKPNGARNESISYPFFDPITLTTTLSPLEEMTIAPKFVYRSEAVFDINDDFENPTVFIKDLDENLETAIVRTNIKNRGGNFSGLIELAGDKTVAEFTTNASFLSDENAGGATFLEFDYLTDVDLFVGYTLETTSGITDQYTTVFVPNFEWKRAYIDFTNVFTSSNIFTYKIKFFMEHNGVGTNQIFLDNIKLVHF